MNRPDLAAEVAAAERAVEEVLRDRAGRQPQPGGETAEREEAERQVAEHALDDWLRRVAARRLRDGAPPLSADDESDLRRAVLARLFGLGELQELLDDDTVESIHVNGAGDVFIRDVDNRIRRVTGLLDGDDDHLVAFVQRLAAHEGLGERRWDVGAPALNLTLRDGSRLHGLMAVTRRPCVTLRRHRLLDVDLDDLVRMGTVPRAVAELLTAAIRCGESTVIAGGPGAGKSTTLRGLASVIPPSQRIVTIEDTLELHLDRDTERHPNCVAIETRPPNIEGRGELSVVAALREALRMDPDVLIVGEVRIEETVPMLLALAAGNVAGSLSTVHAFSTGEALQQLQTYAMVGPERMPGESSARLIGSALDWVVHVERRVGTDGRIRRVLTSVREVCGSQGIQVVSNEVFRHDRNGHAEAFAGVTDETRARLAQVGYDIADLAVTGRFVG